MWIFCHLQRNKSDGTKFKLVDERQSFELVSVQVQVKNVSTVRDQSELGLVIYIRYLQESTLRV